MAHQTNGTMEARLSDPRVSEWLMLATYVVGACGFYIGFSTLSSDGAAVAIRPVALLSVGAVGIISMVRHSVFHRSDAVRAGWDLGQRNNFQIEVGFANLAIGLPAVAAVANRPRPKTRTQMLRMSPNRNLIVASPLREPRQNLRRSSVEWRNRIATQRSVSLRRVSSWGQDGRAMQS